MKTISKRKAKALTKRIIREYAEALQRLANR